MKKYSIKTRITLTVILLILITALIVLFLAEHGVHAPAAGQMALIEMHRYSLLLILSVVCISGALAYSIIQSTMKKIALLSAQIENTTPGESITPLEPPYVDHEIAELVMSFNQMTSKLNETISLQSRFASNIAHEFRTPLAIMQANIDLYRKKNPALSENGDQLLQLITTQIRRLSLLSEELLNLSHLKQEEHGETIDLEAMVHTVLEDLALRFEEKELRAIYHPAPLTMRGNWELLYRALYNIVENAIKYSPPGAAVHTTLSYEGGCNVIRIADEGCGIPPGDREKIFEAFYRVKNASSTSQEGFGLGLTLVKAILDIHRGQIKISENKPSGTVFTLRFAVSDRSY